MPKGVYEHQKRGRRVLTKIPKIAKPKLAKVNLGALRGAELKVIRANAKAARPARVAKVKAAKAPKVAKAKSAKPKMSRRAGGRAQRRSAAAAVAWLEA